MMPENCMKDQNGTRLLSTKFHGHWKQTVTKLQYCYSRPTTDVAV